MESVSIMAGMNTWYDVLFRTNPLPMLVFNRNVQLCLDANGSAASLYERPIENLKGSTFSQLFAPADQRDNVQAEASIFSATKAGLEPRIWKIRSAVTERTLYVQAMHHAFRHEQRFAELIMLHDVTAQWDGQSALRTLERDLNQAQAAARLGSFSRNLVTGEERWSDQAFRNLGLEPRSVVPRYDAFITIVHSDDREMVQATFTNSKISHKAYACVYRVIWADESIHVMQENGVFICDKNNTPVEIIGTTLDITRQHHVEMVLRKTQNDLKKAQEIGHIGTWAFDPQRGEFDAWSDETFRIFGFPISSETPRHAELWQRFHPDDQDRLKKARERALSDPGFHYDVEYRILNPQRGERILHSQAEVQFQYGKALRMVGLLQDITERKRAEERIRYLAYYDATTDLPNRVMLEQVLQDALNTCHRTSSPVSMLLIYLERFRDVNYTLGHADGDALLKLVGKRICDALGEGSFVARSGNAQFAAVLVGVEPSAAQAQIENVLSALTRPFCISGISYELGANIGVSGVPHHAGDVKALIRAANVAQHQARQQGQAYAIYDRACDPYNPQRLALIGEFRKSIKDGQLRLYCQPKADLRSKKIVGVEALVRWQHPVLGRIMPDQFVPQIEATDLIHDLTRYMLDAAISQAVDWRKSGVYLPMAVNVSPRNLMEPGFVSRIKQMLDVSALPPESLGLEITEASLICDPQRTINELRRLDAMGFPIFVDDFGTGYSSLSYLISLPVDVIKIDHSFTMHMEENPNCAAIVRSTIDLAHNLGMKVVAEGTANRKIWDALVELGCDEGQGYFIAPPMQASDFLSWAGSSGFALQAT